VDLNLNNIKAEVNGLWADVARRIIMVKDKSEKEKGYAKSTGRRWSKKRESRFVVIKNWV